MNASQALGQNWESSAAISYRNSCGACCLFLTQDAFAFICPSDLQFAVHAKAEVQTELYIFVTFSSDNTILAELKNDIAASIKYVSSVVQDPCLISKSFSVRNLSVLFLRQEDWLSIWFFLGGRFPQLKHLQNEVQDLLPIVHGQ